VSASVFVSPHLCEFVSPLFSVGFFCTPPFCRFRECYLDFALSLDSVVFLIIPLPCSFGILLTIYVAHSKSMVLNDNKRFGHFFFFNSLDELWAYKYDNLYESALLHKVLIVFNR
jgi:hypothetical protein